MGRFNRFLGLERAREQKEEAQEPRAEDPARAARFGGVQTGAQVEGALAPSGARLARFGEVEEKELGVHRRSPDQPFIRCRLCQGDSTRFATACQNCGEALDTPAQRSFNEALWASLQLQRAQEAEQADASRAAWATAAAEEAKQRREMHEQLARTVRQQTLEGLGESEVGRFLRRWRTLQLGGLCLVAAGMAITWALSGSGRAIGLLLVLLATLAAVALRAWWRR